MSTPADDHGPGSLRRRVAAAPPARRELLLVEHLCAAAARFLSLPAVAAEASWLQLGFDSLRAVDFRGELELELGLGLRSTLLFDQPTPQALARHLLGELGSAAPAATPASARAAAPAEPIAIVGAACRFPGADDLRAFHDLLRTGGCAIGPIPKSRFDVDQLFDPDPAAEGRIYVRSAGLLADIESFDAAFFALSPREATLLDPQQRLLLETSWHALEQANLPPAALAGRRVGVYIGTRASEYFDSQCDRTPRDATSYYATGNAISTAAGRLAYFHGFDGPCYALDTACSGSLVAVHTAVRAIRSGECDLALAGGVNAILDPVPMAGLCRARMLAPDGRCKTFDARADGYGRGEGCGLVVLRRLADAVASGDRILAVIHGTAINQDGRSGGLTVPNGPAQAAVIRQALADARLPPNAIDYVEAHGTGTALGDPIEIGALDDVFGKGRDRPLLVGSVKTNIGHLESAAGVSGLLKTVLALEAGELPPHLHFVTPNPHIDWQRSIVRVVTGRTPLPPRGERAAHCGVSSFGFSGTNCHVVVSAAPVPATATVTGNGRPAGPFVLPLQARCEPALRELARGHADRLLRCGGDAAVPDLWSWCHTAATCRADLPVRAAFVAGSAAELAVTLRRFADGDRDAATAHGQLGTSAPRIAFLFPGQGAQRAGMGQELAAAEPVFRAALERAAAVLAPVLPAPLQELLWGSATALLDRTDVTQPVLCAIELALLDLLRSVGVAPDHVLGHSLGDYPAAVAAGVMDEATALQLCAARGRLMVERCPPGGMLAVLAPPERWQHLLARHQGLAIAVHNGPANAAVAGPPALLQALHRDLQELGVTARLLPVSHAFHAATTEPMLAPFRALLAAVPLRPPVLGFVDARTGAAGGAAFATTEHWVRHVREPVRFAEAVAVLRGSAPDAWLEVGPVPMLSAVIAEHGLPGPKVLPLQRPNRPARATFLQALAALWVRGVAVDLGAANHGRGAARAELPLYPFQRRRFWLQRHGEKPAAGAGPRHPLLGDSSPSALLAATDARYTNRLSAQSPAWLADHGALGHVLLPAAGMLECALAAEFAARGSLPVAVRSAALRAPLVLTGSPVLVESLRTTTEDGVAFRLLSQDPADAVAGFRTHFECRTGAPGPADLLDRTGALSRCTRAVPADAFYAHCTGLGLAYGPSFRGVQSLRAGDGELVAELALPDDLLREPFVVHPALLDACFQTLAAVMTQDDGLFLPLGAEEVAVLASPQATASVVARVRPVAGAARIADLDLFDAQGTLCVRVRGLQLVPAEARALAAASRAHRELLYHVDFVPAPLAADLPPPPAGVLLAGDQGLGAALQARLPATAGHVAPVAQVPAALARHRIAHVVYAPEPAPAGEQPMQAVERIFRGALVVAQAAARAPGPPRVWFVTQGTQAAGPAPAGPPPLAAVLLGLARTLAHEHPALRPTCIDLDPVVPPTDHDAHAAVLCTELRVAGDETEIAWRQGQRRVARLRRGPVPPSHLSLPRGPFRLRAAEYGSFDHLRAEPAPRRTPGPGELEVEVLAAALNFKDVLHVAGRLREFAERAGIASAREQPLGFEGSGRVVSVGAGVTDRTVGQSVVVLAPDCLGSHVTVPATATFVLPAGVDPVAAAGLPTVFATVLHGLVGCARLRAGETVLVHAAAGGIGLAAIQVCRWLGCRALATASPGKQAFLRSLGIEVVGDTRTAEFGAGVRTSTAGRGVEVVLNTLSGAAVPKSLEVLAPGGRFVELGKLGVFTREQVAAVRPDVQFTAFDLGDEFARDPALRPRLLEELRLGLAAGHFAPPVATVLALCSARPAFQQLAQGRHVGKIVLRLPPASDAQHLRGDRTWILTGAGGGVIPAVAQALVTAGVRSLGLLARSEVPAALVEDLRQRGCRVLALRADVTDRAALARALGQVRSELPPIGGVVHAAGALADAVATGLDWATAQRALLPKIAGALLLDELTADDPLDAFVSFSSMAGLLGNAGQAAYAAANTFLDAFAAWRTARGRPGVAIAWGPWDGAGMTARLDQRLRARLATHGVQMLPPAVATEAMFAALEAGPLVAVLPVQWATWLAGYRAAPPFLRELRPRGAPEDRAATAIDFAALPPAERERTLRTLVKRHVAAVLGFEDPDQFDRERTFRELGLDSLLAVDARDRLERALRLSLPATLLFDHPDLDRLVAWLLRRLFPGAQPAQPAPLAPAVPAAAAATDDVVESLDTEALAEALAAQVRRMEARP